MTGETSNPAISALGLCHWYGKRQALDDVAFEVASGQFVALLGPNGAGKTTIFSLLTRLLRPGKGSLSIFGHDLARTPRQALRHIGVVFQQPTLDLDLTVSQNLAYHGAIQGMRPRDVRERTEHELARFDLLERRAERVRNLNGGHRRRVEIARALLHRPSLLLLDEASAGLDLESRQSLYQYVRGLCDEQGLSVLWTTHLVEELALQDQAILLSQGKVRATGIISDLVADQGVEDPRALVLALSQGRSG